MNGSRRAPLLRAPGLVACAALLTLAPALAAQDGGRGGVVFLVRHAEKVEDGSADPALTEEGRARARELARTLKDAGVERVHSTDTRRTLRTAAPLARELGVEVERYDGGNLASIAERVRAAGGRHLVVGHSNTTPELVELLGGDPGAPIVEAWEYDRLYVVTQGSDGRVRTVLLRYGTPARP